MRKSNSLLLAIFSILLISSCSKDQTDKSSSQKNKKETIEKKATDFPNSELSKYDLSSQNPQTVTLPKDLREISGITMTPDGRLFCQQDEEGIVYQIDISNGNIIKKISLGNPPIKKDFEDITFANNKFYMLQSNGHIYEFTEGNDGESVPYNVYKPELTGSLDIEGLCYDSETNSLLLAVKGVIGVTDQRDKDVYSFSLANMKLDPQPRFSIKYSDLTNSISPSGIERNPLTGTFFVIASQGKEIVEISKDGKFLGKQALSKKLHSQPEGITFASDGTMYISNENKSAGYIVVYPLKK